jgi:hypothetical protein
MNFRPVMSSIPPVVKNLIIINVLLLIATYVLQNAGIDLVEHLAMYYPESEKFRLHQIITHMFMHGGLTHLFFNMFALYMFGRVLESVWGSQRFLVYYFVTGLGAIALHNFVNYLEFSSIQNAIEAYRNTPSPEVLDNLLRETCLRHRHRCAILSIPGTIILQFILCCRRAVTDGTDKTTEDGYSHCWGIRRCFWSVAGIWDVIPQYSADAALPPYSNKSKIFCYRVRCS